MTLYEIMNKKPEELVVNEVPAPSVPATAPAEEPVAVAVKENEAPQVVTQEPKPTYKHTSWWQTPNFVAEQEKLENIAKQRMEADEKRARWQRHAAIIGDVAKLGLQSAALAGGAKKVDRFTPETTSANEKMQAIRDRNAAQIMEFAKQKAAAREAERADKIAKGKLEASLAASEAEREYKQRQRAEDVAHRNRVAEETARHNEEMEKIQRGREVRLTEQGGTSKGKGVNRDVYLVNDDGTRTEFKQADEANNVQAAYAKLPEGYKAKKAVPRVQTSVRGRKVYVKDENGKHVYDYEIDLDASLEQKRQAIADYNARELKKAEATAQAKKKNPMASDKKQNPMS